MASIIPAFSKPIYQKSHDIPEIDLSGISWREMDENSRSLDAHVFERPEFAPLKKIAQDCVNDYFYNVMKTHPATKIFITGSWMSKTLPGHKHRAHTHPNSILSGTMYIQGDYFSTNFFTPGATLEFQYEELNIFNRKMFHLEFDRGDVCIFPSDLWHYIDVYEGSIPRITLAWNTFVKGLVNDTSTADLEI